MKKQTGFTLIELIISVVILGILAAIAGPNYNSMIRKNQQSSAYNILVGAISLARLEAIKRSQVVTLCISSNQATCDVNTETAWEKGWIVFVDSNGDNLVDTDEVVLKAEPAAKGGIEVTSDFGSVLAIAPRGRLKSQGSFVICDGSGISKNGMSLNLWVTGLGRQATDTDDNGIVEKIDGTDISC